MNSKFSNNMPMAKYKNFGNEEVLKELSIKLNEMMSIVKETGEWCTDEIREFETKARKRILEGVQVGCARKINEC